MSDPAAYKAYAELLASGLASNAHPTPEASHEESPRDPNVMSSPLGPDQEERQQLSLQAQHGDITSSAKESDQQQQQLLQVTTTSPSLVPFPAPGSVPVAYFAGPGGSIIAIPQLKSKRRQVKNACTNCQKACKKCDEVRPCTRCVKYSMEAECVDSQRKERKKGIKRGPYKKREQKNEEDEAQNQLAAAAAVAAATAAAQISILTPDNAAALQAMGGIIYSYAPVQTSPQPVASGSGSGNAGTAPANNTNLAQDPNSVGAATELSPDQSQNPHGSTQISALSPIVPPPGPTAASYAYHPQFYVAPSQSHPDADGNGSSNNTGGSSTPRQPSSSHGQHTQDRAQEQAHYYATIAAAYFGGAAGGNGAGGGVGTSATSGGIMLQDLGSGPMSGNGEDGNGNGNGGVSGVNSPGVNPAGPSSANPRSPVPASSHQNHALFHHLSPSTMSVRQAQAQAQAAADDPIERHVPPPPQPNPHIRPQVHHSHSQSQSHHQHHLHMPHGMMKQAPGPRPLLAPVPTNMNTLTRRAPTPVGKKAPKGEKRKRENGEGSSSDQPPHAAQQQPGPERQSSDGDDQRQAVRQRQALSVE